MNTAYFSVIADGLGVPEYFSRLYKKTYNISPNEHIHKMRMQAAKEKLILTIFC